MPSRSTMLTGQHPSTHGVWMNGVALPVDAPSVAAELQRAGYRTALVGKPHFEPFLDPFGRFTENRLADLGVPTAESPWHDGTVGPHRGFDHLEFATHTPMGGLHYARYMQAEHPESLGGFYAVLDADLEVNAAGGGDTGAPQVKDNPVAREWYHTDWVADRTIAWLDGLDAGRRLVRLDELPRPAPPVGPARRRSCTGSTGVTCPCPPATSRMRRSGSASSTTSPATGGSGTTASWSRTTRRPRSGCRRRSPPTRCARSTPATPSRSSSSTRRSGGCSPPSTPGAGPTTSTSSSRPTTASSRATSASSSRGRTTWTGSCDCHWSGGRHPRRDGYRPP